MSFEQEIYDKLVEVYPHGVKDITSMSYNDAGALRFIESAETGFDFDLVYNLSPIYKSPQKEKTPDSLFIVKDRLFFVEFKEGGDDKGDIRLKIHEGIVSLFMFVKRHLPSIAKADFVNLRITYIVIVRKPADQKKFLRILREKEKMHQLRNLEGFLVGGTYYTVCPKHTATLLSKVTEGRLKFIDVHERDGTVSRHHA